MKTQRLRVGERPGPTRCSACGAEMRCGAVLGEDSCWCDELPAVEPRVAPGETPACLCEACLRRRLGEERADS